MAYSQMDRHNFPDIQYLKILIDSEVNILVHLQNTTEMRSENAHKLDKDWAHRWSCHEANRDEEANDGEHQVQAADDQRARLQGGARAAVWNFRQSNHRPKISET